MHATIEIGRPLASGRAKLFRALSRLRTSGLLCLSIGLIGLDGFATELPSALPLGNDLQRPHPSEAGLVQSKLPGSAPAGYSESLKPFASSSASGSSQQAVVRPLLIGQVDRRGRDASDEFILSQTASTIRGQDSGHASDESRWLTLELPSWLGESRIKPLPPVDGPQTLMRWSYGEEDEPTHKLEEALKTDRPDFTEASTTVGKGVLQVEFGYTYTFDREGQSQLVEHSIGEVLLRYGVFADWLELRLAVLPINLKETDGGSTLRAKGVEDLYLGAKFALTPQDGWLPEMALTPQMTVPSGSSVFNGGDVHYGLNWLYGWDITDDWNIAGSTQFNRGLDNLGQHYVEFAQAMTVNHSFNETVGGYAEWFALIPTRSEVGPTEHYFNGGITWKLSNDIQYDVRAGVGLNEPAADYFLGTGLALRFH